jgi:hypothetical protein
MNWFKNLFKKKEVEELPDLETNENVFRVTYLEKMVDEPKHILCNGKEVEIEWDEVVRFDEGGLGYEPTHYRKRAKRTPKMFVAHWDACLSTAQMHQVTKERGLSVHFGIDNDGTIYQLLDTKDIAWHARGINTQSIGVEIANPVKLRYNARYKKKGQPLRKVVLDDVIHGKKCPPYLDFYPVQLEAFKALARAVCKAHNIPLAAPLDKSGALVRGVDRRVQGRSFRGIVGHYHVTNTKTDPGRMPLDEIVKELTEEK